jgi:hypothetical protein
MKIKAKLTLGIVFLFVEFLIITLFSAYSIYSISKQSEKIMKDNNLSIQYAENMQQAIDQINAYQIAILFNPSKMNNDNELIGIGNPRHQKSLRFLFSKSVAEIPLIEIKDLSYFGDQHAVDHKEKRECDRLREELLCHINHYRFDMFFVIRHFYF